MGIYEVSGSQRIKTGNYLISINKSSIDYIDLLQEMCILKSNQELTTKEKNARLNDILSKK